MSAAIDARRFGPKLNLIRRTPMLGRLLRRISRTAPHAALRDARFAAAIAVALLAHSPAHAEHLPGELHGPQV